MTTLEPIQIDEATFLREHFTLPALPRAITKIQRLIEGGDADMGIVAELISSEPALVAQVLKIANSAYYGLPREVKNVKFALAFLGLNEIYRMVLSLSVVNTLGIKEKKELQEFWFHSFYTSLCTKYLAKKYEQHLSFEELWSAAILHDVGKMIYLKFFPEHFKALNQYTEDNGCTFSVAEAHFALPPSARFGSLLCDHWRLPVHVKTACELHTLADLPRTEGDKLTHRFARMICLGNLLTILSTDELNQDQKNDIVERVQEALHCDESEFLAMMGDIYELRVEVERFTEQFF